MSKPLKLISLTLLAALAVCGCSSDAKTEARIRRAYAAGEEAARAQMEQARQQQQTRQQPQPMQPMGAPLDSMIRILGHVKNPMLTWSDGLTLGRALVEAQYEDNSTPRAITIYRNNQPLQIDPQRLLQGQDFPLYPGDTIWIQE
ncbi:MAG TPA: hypothetical protein VN761_13870 [Candidatus Polarisedimenticolia bacterium]|nr:hypothetical protein [Candidatus Polarisedimenticolia bacterium]